MSQLFMWFSTDCRLKTSTVVFCGDGDAVWDSVFDAVAGDGAAAGACAVVADVPGAAWSNNVRKLFPPGACPRCGARLQEQPEPRFDSVSM
jgi:hypothetical protein